MKTFKQGDVVRFEPDWCEPRERECIMVVLEAWDDVQKCEVQHLRTNMIIRPIETVSYEMIQKM